MNEHAQALALSDLGQALLACLDGRLADTALAISKHQLLEIAHECREIAQRVILHSAGATPSAWERRHLLAEMALRLALNIEYAAEGCTTCFPAQGGTVTCDAVACATTRDALRNTTIIVVSVLNATRFAEDRRRAHLVERPFSRLPALS
ncbi:hypothetical protein [Actinomadura rudentiformis]|uniref:Uncharacterized protein n=1 Tax=Actinomadura rudentiformis TaxID=359158 RepID=A0A6H9YYK0_9ACTN|nr:hypothetical protein [Actinomadura rudentiformis]KAB2349414.1 hypothetical protein F8566_11495 [Actinomadura rudentiformis]